jgi:peptidoglycan/LPS O-acetylase OafA/YrhL
MENSSTSAVLEARQPPATVGRNASARIPSLDGLRGIAALIVVLHHSLLTSKSRWDVYTGQVRPEVFSPHWWATFTPAHGLWAGSEAVLVFFVLSGYVLAGPVMRTGNSWARYYVQRLPRLYLPVWGAILFVVLIGLVVPRENAPLGSLWLRVHHPVTPDSMLQNALLIFGTDSLNSPLWSLRWEVYFSLLLPVYVFIVWLACRSAAGTLVLTAALLATIVTGIETSQEPLRYLPVFALGMIMYVRREWLARAAGALDRARPAGWVVTTVAAMLFLTAPWTASNVHWLPAQASWALHGLQIVGAMLAVFVASSCQGARKVLAGRVVLWLGTRSFSLYLIHEPIVVAVGYAQGGTGPVWATFGISLAVALVLTEVFFRVVEKPSHQLAKRLGALVDGRRRRVKTQSSIDGARVS